MLSYDQSVGFYGAVPPPSRPAPSLARPSTATSQIMAASPVVHRRHIWIITGPAGCGKSTLAQYLAEYYSLPYIEGDEFHPKANVDKMTAGTPLTDADRWDWLILLRQQATEALNTGARGVVLTCSALKLKYRDVIRVAAYRDHDIAVHFIYLQADEQTLLERVKARKGHYMKDSMVRSQFTSLEEPTTDEGDVLCIDVSGNAESVRKLAVEAMSRLLAEDAASKTTASSPTSQ